MKRSRLAWIGMALSVTAACGDDGGGADTDAPPSPDAGVDAGIDATPGAPVVAITSHTDGQRITGGNRTITIAGTLADPDTDPITAVTVTVGTAAPVTATFDQASFSASIQLGDNDNIIVVSATDATARSGSDQVSLAYPFVALSSFPSATMVLGQSSFTNGNVRTADAGRLRDPSGIPTEIDGVLYASDVTGNRVLGFRGFPAQNGARADFVLGQVDFTAAATGITANLLDDPRTVLAYGGRMYLIDRSRILIYATPPTTTYATASGVIGQANLTANDSACAATGLNRAEHMIVAGTRLVVADSSNSRVLIWNTVPTAGGVAPDLVLGQGDFTHCQIDDDNQDGSADAAPTARTLDYPTGLWSDGTRLAVADTYNNRVLIWNTFPTTSFQAPDLVLGQPDAASGGAGTAADRFSEPYHLASNGNQLFVADRGNHRIKVWNSFPTTNAPADVVLGQSDFGHVQFDDDNQDGNQDGNPSARTLRSPKAVWFLRDRLFVTDTANHRLLMFGAPVCALDMGLYEYPAGSGTCIDDPCDPSSCTNQRTCDRSTGAAVCTCPGGWAEDCNLCVRFADSAATGVDTGLSWTDAYTSVAAAADAAYNTGQACEVWVKEGTHYIYRTADTDSVNLRGPIAVRGGFAGTEATLASRAGGATILDGRNAAAGTSDVYHVLSSASGGIAGTPALERLTIQYGNADGAGNNATGGGLLVASGARVAITDCVFQDNRASGNGGGVFYGGGATGSFTMSDARLDRNVAGAAGGGLYAGASISLDATTFTGNYAGTAGGGASLSGGTVTGCDLIGNSVGTAIGHGGGGLHVAGVGSITGTRLVANTAVGDAGGLWVRGGGSTWTITDCELVSNRGQNGGGVYFDASGSTSTMSECVVAGNVATGAGGGLFLRDASPTLTNLTVSGNVAANYGGGFMLDGTTSNISNTIVWGNAAPSSSQIRTSNFVGTVTYSDVEGGWTGTGNLATAPAFVRAPSVWDRAVAAPDLVTVTVVTGASFAVGDYIEIADDGVARQIAAVSGNDLTFTPARAAAVAGVTVQNWGTQSANLVPDFHLSAGSACIATGTPAGTDMGAYP